ncbi:MAG: DUF4270 family protein [Breznakibacter sp.]|nr:DUF4270 family protein [Breznakibacter sp.]
MISIFSNKISLFLLVGLTALLFSCKDDAMLAGKDLLPEEYNLNGYSREVSGIIAENTTRDSIKSDQVTYAILGDFTDEIFGKSVGAFVGQVYKGAVIDSISLNRPKFSVDSMVFLSVHNYGDWYGLGNESHRIKVYELTETLSNGLDVYYSNFNMEGKYDTTPIGEGELKGNSLDSASWVLNKYVDTLRVKIRQDVATRFFENFTREMSSNNSQFLDFFKGIYITSEWKTGDGQGSLVRCRVMGSTLGLKLYYNYDADPSDTVKVHYSHIFPITRDGVTFNKYEHTINPNIKLDNPVTDNLYAQGMAGSYVKVTLPEDDLTDYGDSLSINTPGERVAFSNVTLEFFVDTAASKISSYTLPDSLTLYRFNDYEKSDINNDLSNDKIEAPFYYVKVEGETPVKMYKPVIGGALNKSTYSYKFTIDNEFFKRIVTRDDLIDKDNQLGLGNEDDFKVLYIGPNNPVQNFRRVILYGQNRTDGKVGVKMKIRTVKY